MTHGFACDRDLYLFEAIDMGINPTYHWLFKTVTYYIG